MGIPATLSSVPAQTPYIQYVATSGQTVFPYPFEITQDSDLVAVANGTTLATDSGYALSGVGASTGGNLTFTSGRTAGDIITLYRDIPIERLTQFAQNGGFSSTAFNAEFNNVYLLLQQLQQNIDQCLQIPNTNNPAPTTTLLPGTYASKYLAFDSNGNPTPAVLTNDGSITAQMIGGLIYPRTQAEINASITPSDLTYPFGDMRRYGLVASGSGDNTPMFASVFSMFKTVGGTISFPAGDYAGYIDLSGTNNAEVIVEGNGCTLRPYTSTPTNSCVVYCNNGGSGGYSSYQGSNFSFRNINFTGRLHGSSTTGDINYAMQIMGSQVYCWNCTFQYGILAGYYSMFGQYSEFWECQFANNTANGTTAGCILDSHTAAGQSNEVVFMRCELFSNSTALWTKGAFKVRLYAPQVQNNSSTTGAIIIDQDSTGLGSAAISIRDGWFESNSGPHIYEVVGQGINIEGCLFTATAGVNKITTTNCLDLTMAGNFAYTTMTCSINHPSGATNTAQLCFWGNNFEPSTFAIAHSGPSLVDGPPYLTQNSTPQGITGGSQTISHLEGLYTTCPVTTTGSWTGMILQAGQYAGQVVRVLNQSNYTLTMAASGTSNVADGTSCVIPALKSMTFTWDAASSLWYHD